MARARSRDQTISSSGGIFLFFFSSRRRHTRFDCDWSSDVCSSDLAHLAKVGDQINTRIELDMQRQPTAPKIDIPLFDFSKLFGSGQKALKPKEGRSEEHTSELQSQSNLVCRLLLEKKND